MRPTLSRYRALLQKQLLTRQHRSIMLNVARYLFSLHADMARLRRFIDYYPNFIDDKKHLLLSTWRSLRSH